MFETQCGARCLRWAEIWGADGTFKVAPGLWAQLYTVHDAMGGYVPPCIFALPPNKTGATYDRMWRQIRAIVGEEDADAARMVTVDFERALINAIAAMFPEARIARCYLHLGQSLYRGVQRLGAQGQHEANEDFRLRVKTLSPIAFLPEGDIARAFDDFVAAVWGWRDTAVTVLRPHIRRCASRE